MKYATKLLDIKNIIGIEAFNEIDNYANGEVGLAKCMKLEIDRQFQYYTRNFYLPKAAHLYYLFEDKGFKITPDDLVEVMFRCKLIYSCKTEMEYRQRAGGVSHDYGFVIDWNSGKGQQYEVMVDWCLQRMESCFKERILSTKIDMVNNWDKNKIALSLKQFFEGLYDNFNIGFVYTENEKGEICVGIKIDGSKNRCYWYGCQLLRSFLAILKISAFRFPAQFDSGSSGIQIFPTISPVFLDDGSRGGFDYGENERPPFLRYPDGSMYRSIGNGSFGKTWLDVRNFEAINKCFGESKVIFEYLTNPWRNECINDIAPILDLLSSATKAQWLGLKILLFYCSLEHLFVPKGKNNNNREYIVGGINALNPKLLDWFGDLYKLRCDYAHKGFILGDKNNLQKIMGASLGNIIHLLLLKLEANK